MVLFGLSQILDGSTNLICMEKIVTKALWHQAPSSIDDTSYNGFASNLRLSFLT